MMSYQGKGRPSKIDEVSDRRWDMIVAALEDGVPYKFISDLAGVTFQTWLNWMTKGESDRREGKISSFTEFLDRIEAAKNRHVRQAISAMKLSERGHKGHEWVLSRRHPESFHQGTKLEHSGNINGDHTVTVFDPSVLDQLENVDDMDDEGESVK
jgi:hypothetical protein